MALDRFGRDLAPPGLSDRERTRRSRYHRRFRPRIALVGLCPHPMLGGWALSSPGLLAASVVARLWHRTGDPRGGGDPARNAFGTAGNGHGLGIIAPGPPSPRLRRTGRRT